MTGQVTLSELIAAGSRRADEARTAEGSHGLEDLLAEAVHEHARFVFKVAYSVLRNREDAEDAVQDTFLRATRHGREFIKVDNRRAWLARTVWRIAIDRTRQVRHFSLDDEGVMAAFAAMKSREGAAGIFGSHPPLTGKGAAPNAGFGPGAEALLINEQMLALLRSFIAALPADLRYVVTLSTVKEMTSAEAAVVLGIPENSVRTRLFRARQLLKEKFTAVLERRERQAGGV